MLQDVYRYLLAIVVRVLSIQCACHTFFILSLTVIWIEVCINRMNIVDCVIGQSLVLSDSASCFFSVLHRIFAYFEIMGKVHSNVLLTMEQSHVHYLRWDPKLLKYIMFNDHQYLNHYMRVTTNCVIWKYRHPCSFLSVCCILFGCALFHINCSHPHSVINFVTSVLYSYYA